MSTKETAGNSDLVGVEETYRLRGDSFAGLLLLHERASNRLANLRVFAFLASVASLGWAWADETLRQPSLVVAAVCFVAFIFLVYRHRRVLVARRRAAAFKRMNEQGAARVRRRWSALPVIEVPGVVGQNAVARDLDLFGSASLYQLLCLAHTPLGKQRLAEWLLAPEGPDAIPGRQEAVAELAPRLEWRQELEFCGMPEREALPPAEPFLDWAEGESWFASRQWLLWASRLLPILMTVLFVLDFFGLFSQSVWMMIPLVNIAVSMYFVRAVHGIFARVSSREGEIERYAQLLKLTAGGDFAAGELQRLVSEFQTDGHTAHHQINRLRRLIDTADLRFSQIYLPVQAFTLWDFHILAAVESWQREFGRHVRKWFEALAEIEALASIAALAHDNPAWVFPHVHQDASLGIKARGLGHPLLSPQSCVANDVELGPPGSFLLVTGSNMSGKSTLLRSIGMNAILAQCGSPVCAKSLDLPALVVGTSVLIQDSLESGVSFFMAELNRLKEIVDDARRIDRSGDRVFLYLLDEILLGTNSVERQIAVRRVMQYLLSHRSIGAISTHDLSLADTPELAVAAKPVHFRETIAQDPHQPMTFDYQLREGLATTTNALKLLEIVGLGGPEEEE